MAALRTFQVGPEANIHEITQVVSQNLSQQGFQCNPQPMGPQSTSLIVSKDRDGIQNFAGLGIECRVSLSINGSQLQVTIDSEWTNKYIAIGVGLFLCWICLITGIIGCLNQNSLPEKIFNAINMAVSSFGGGAPFQQYQAPQQYAPQPQQYQAPQQYAPQPQQYQAPQAPQAPQYPQDPQAPQAPQM